MIPAIDMHNSLPDLYAAGMGPSLRLHDFEIQFRMLAIMQAPRIIIFLIFLINWRTAASLAHVVAVLDVPEDA